MYLNLTVPLSTQEYKGEPEKNAMDDSQETYKPHNISYVGYLTDLEP